MDGFDDIKVDFNFRERSALECWLATFSILLVEFVLGYIFVQINFSEIQIFTVFEVGILTTAFFTGRYLCSFIGSIGILVFSYFFSMPMYSFRSDVLGYPFIQFTLMLSAIMMASLEKSNRRHIKRIMWGDYRGRVLLRTSQILLKANNRQDVIYTTANSLMKILKATVFLVPLDENEQLQEPYIRLFEGQEKLRYELDEQEYRIIKEVIKGKKHHEEIPIVEGKYFYLPLITRERCYGVVGIDRVAEKLEEAVRLYVSTCSLAFEREYYSQLRQQQLIQMKNEKLRSDLLHSISHDLRTPLTGISGNAALIYKQGENLSLEQIEDLAKGIWKESSWLIDLIENVLSITRLENVAEQILMKPALIEDIIQVNIDNVKYHSPDLKIIFDTNTATVVYCNPQLISQVVKNLLENAIKYTKEDERIFIEVEERENMVAVRISDEGNGIAQKEKEHIFDKFYLPDGERVDKTRGFGIGLALCKQIVEQHGGKITLTDAVPHGAVFTFTVKKARIHNEENNIDSGR